MALKNRAEGGVTAQENPKEFMEKLAYTYDGTYLRATRAAAWPPNGT